MSIYIFFAFRIGIGQSRSRLFVESVGRRRFGGRGADFSVRKSVDRRANMMCRFGFWLERRPQLVMGG